MQAARRAWNRRARGASAQGSRTPGVEHGRSPVPPPFTRSPSSTGGNPAFVVTAVEESGDLPRDLHGEAHRGVYGRPHPCRTSSTTAVSGTRTARHVRGAIRPGSGSARRRDHHPHGAVNEGRLREPRVPSGSCRQQCPATARSASRPCRSLARGQRRGGVFPRAPNDADAARPRTTRPACALGYAGGSRPLPAVRPNGQRCLSAGSGRTARTRQRPVSPSRHTGV